jgi:hypothetical protein
LEKNSAAFLSAQEILTACQDGFQGKFPNPPSQGDRKALKELLDELHELAGYPLASTPEWTKTENSRRSIPTPTSTTFITTNGLSLFVTQKPAIQIPKSVLISCSFVNFIKEIQNSLH